MRKAKTAELKKIDENKFFNFLMRFDTDVHERIKLQALRRFGITVTAYIRIAVMEKLEKDETEEAAMRKKHVRA